jgi:diacylglycerol kinase (ATP)
MSTTAIHNPSAGAAEQWPALRRELDTLGELTLIETKQPGDAARAAADATRRGDSLLIAIGGDGTVNEIVNGTMRTRLHTGASRPTLAIVPLGTGNDLARTLGVPLEPLEAIKLLRERPATARIDLMRVRSETFDGFCANVAAGGFTGQMNEALTDELKSRWGPLAYLRGAVKVLPDLTKYSTTIRYDGSAPQPVHAMNVIVANGRTAGGGTIVAAQADPTDGLLDIVIVRTGTVLELTGVAARLLAGDYTTSDLVTHRRAKRVQIESTPGMWFNIDGELITNEPVTFSVVPGALNVVVGKDFKATPENE